MKTDIFPYAGWVQREDGLWARCKHPLNVRQVCGGSLDPPLVVCVACGLSDSVVFHDKQDRQPQPPSDKQVVPK